MLKKSITYKDLDDNDVTEDFYFNISKAEFAILELSHKGGFAASLTRIAEAQDGKTIIETFRDILKLAYGVRSEDGKRFIKNDGLWDEFTQTDAFNVLFMELVTDAEKSAEFVKGIVPKDMSEAVDKALKADEKSDTEQPPWIRENRDPTQAELSKMTPDELRDAFRRKNKE